MASKKAVVTDSDNSSSEEEVTMPKLRPRNQDKDSIICVPLKLPENVLAFLDKAKLERSNLAQPIGCSSEVLEKVFTNYVIVKNILSHLPWQDKLVCEEVSPLWDSAVKRLRKEQLEPVDFSINIAQIHKVGGVTMMQSGEFYTDPLVVFVFNYNTCDEHPSAKCELTTPPPCRPPCKKHHSSKYHNY